MGKKFILNLDIDGCLADFISAFREHLGLSLEQAPPPKNWNFAGEWGLPDKWFGEGFKEFARLRGFNVLVRPLLGVQAGIKKLREEGHHINIVTARGTEPFFAESQFLQNIIRHDTLEWLHRHGIRFDSIHFIADKRLVHCDVALEDSPSHITNYVKRGTEVVVMSYDYNYKVGEKYGLKLVENFAQFVDYVKYWGGEDNV